MNVSPITQSETPSSNTQKPSPSTQILATKPPSHIPVPKGLTKSTDPSPAVSAWKEKAGSIASPTRDGRLTKWDDFSGEPTLSEKGKAAQLQYPSTVRLKEQSPTSTTTTIPARDSVRKSPGNVLADRLRKVGRRQVGQTNQQPPEREPWKGASGRQTIVKPMVDKPLPDGKRASFPRGSFEAHDSPKSPTPGRMSPAPPHGSRKSSLGHARRPSLQTPPKIDTLMEYDDPIPPTVPLKINKIQSPLQSPTSTTFAPTPAAVPLPSTPQNEISNLLDNRSPLARNPSDEKLREEKGKEERLREEKVREKNRREEKMREENLRGKRFMEERRREEKTRDERMREKLNQERKISETAKPISPSGTPPASQEGRQSASAEQDFRAGVPNMHIDNQPQSRFSATTYATTQFNDSPPATPRASTDSRPALPTPPDSILNRKRPVPNANIFANKAAVTARKPTPSQNLSNGKALPKSPPENNAVDPIGTLQAKLDNLHRRRINLKTVIHELTHVVQPSSIAYDLASRQEIKRTVDGLEAELAEVVKEEHETGLKLHRAMKRHDNNAMYEPTGLWVRRVTT